MLAIMASAGTLVCMALFNRSPASVRKRRLHAFKFKPSSHFDQALDIILNRRLYCAKWETLNDPMEGRFILAQSGGDHDDEIVAINKKAKRLRVCALSRPRNRKPLKHLLWAHYAAGFDGLAIEVDIPNYSDVIQRVYYDPQLAEVEHTEDLNPKWAAVSVLTRKFKAWRYEDEVRIIQRSQWFPLDRPVVRVIAGHRMKPALLRGLQVICREQSIELKQTHIPNVDIELRDVEL